MKEIIMKEYTISDFKENRYQNVQHTTETALFYPGADSSSINYSFILTKLIQEAGRWCRFHASDLFIMWDSIERALTYENLKNNESISFLFGFYESGVHGEEGICSRYNNCTERYIPRLEYRAIYRLDIKAKMCEHSELGAMDVEMDLYEVQR